MGTAQLDVIPVENKKQWKAFVKFPYQHYKNDPNWVPPLLIDQKVLLNPEKHPFYKHADVQFFVAYLDGKIVGRIAAIIDHNHNEFHQEKTGMFGFFETINDFDVAEGLLSTAKVWVTERGMTAFRGPLNPCQNEDCGLLIDAYDSPPVIMMTYNPPYYKELVEKFGLKKVMDLYAYHVDGRNPPPEKLVRVAEALRKRNNLVVRPIDMKRFDEEADKVWLLYNKAWSKNWGFVPMTKEEFDHLAKNLKSVIVPEIALLAELDGEPIGFSLSLPDMNQALIKLKGRLLPFGLLKLLWYSKKINLARIIILGIVHEHQRHGFDSILYLDTWRNAGLKGYWQGEMSWVLENNEMMNRAARMLGGKVYKTYRLYEMKT